MIAGEDLIAELGTRLDFKLKTIVWDRITCSMRSIHASEKLINKLREENMPLLAIK